MAEVIKDPDIEGLASMLNPKGEVDEKFKAKIKALEEELQSLENRHKTALIKENEELSSKFNHMKGQHDKLTSQLSKNRQKAKEGREALKEVYAFLAAQSKVIEGMMFDLCAAINDKPEKADNPSDH